MIAAVIVGSIACLAPRATLKLAGGLLLVWLAGAIAFA